MPVVSHSLPFVPTHLPNPTLKMEIKDNMDRVDAQYNGKNYWAWTNVACLRCKDHKVRCTRELPSCTRCNRQKSQCKYPKPPDRRRIALKASRSRASAVAATPKAGASGQLAQQNYFAITTEPQAAAAAQPKTLSNNDTSPSIFGFATGLSADSTENDDLPPTEIGLLLLEIYFKRVYNASLLFHKSICFHLYRDNGIPGYLLRAIFAQAAIFLQNVELPHPEYKRLTDTVSAQPLFEKSWSWARSASREVLSNIDEPTLVRVQALQVLQLYYFSRGSIQRARVHVSLAYQLCRDLGYDQLLKDASIVVTNHNLQFDHEVKRRCFWACWASLCMCGCKSDYLRKLQELKGLPLPVRLEKDGVEIYGVELNLGQKIDDHLKLGEISSPSNKWIASDSPCSLMAELVKLVDIWSSAQAFIAESPKRPYFQREAQLGHLLSLLDSIEWSLRPSLNDICDQAEYYDESPELLTSICSMYYLCRLLLHVSMVPSLCGYTAEDPNSTICADRHTEEALEQAIRLVRMLQQFVSKGLDITKLWHYTGYGAFVAGVIFAIHQHTPNFPFQSSKVPASNSAEMNTIQMVLEVLGAYWEPIRNLISRLDEAIRTGKYFGLDSRNSPSFPLDMGRPGSTVGVFDDTFHFPNNPQQSAPLAQTPPSSRPYPEDQPFPNTFSYGGEMDGSCQMLTEQQQLYAPQMITPSPSDAPQPSVPEPNFFDEFLSSDYEGTLFDADWGTVINLWGLAAPPLVEMPPRDPPLFF